MLVGWLTDLMMLTSFSLAQCLQCGSPFAVGEAGGEQKAMDMHAGGVGSRRPSFWSRARQRFMHGGRWQGPLRDAVEVRAKTVADLRDC